MKKILTLLIVIALLIVLFCSCSEKQELKGDSPKHEISSEKKKISVLFTKSDSGFLIHEYRFNIAKRILEETYGIEVERYYVPGYEDSTENLYQYEPRGVFYEKLYAEMIAGKGPDVFLFGAYGTFFDLYKKFDAGAFYDLNEFIENDEDFDIDEYEDILLDVGVYKGKRYLFPITYGIKPLLISKSKFENLNLSVEDFSTYDRFVSTWDSIQKDGTLKFLANTGYWSEFLCYEGWLEECIDYEAGTVDFSLPAFQNIVEIMQTEYMLDNNSDPLAEFETYEDSLFYVSGFISLMFTPFYDFDATDVMMIPVPNSSGNNTAQVMDCFMISSASKNPDAAWLFVKAMLSDAAQREMMNIQSSHYVSTKSALIDESIETIISLSTYEWLPEYIPDEALTGRIKELHHNYDNAVIPFVNTQDLYQKIENYIKDNDRDIDSLRTELENYYRLYLSE